MRSVQKPSTELVFKTVPANANSSASATPVTISGFVMGMLVMVMTAERSRPFMPWMPTAAIVPTMVEMSVASSAMMTELRSSVRSVPSRNRLAYCRSVKPLKLAMSVPVLNEAMARTIIGIYRKMNTRMVMVLLMCFIP